MRLKEHKKEMLFHLPSLGLINALGASKSAVCKALLNGETKGMRQYQTCLLEQEHYCGVVNDLLPEVPPHLSVFDCRNNQLLLAAIEQISADIRSAKNYYGSHRIGIILGTSTSGISEAETAINSQSKTGVLPDKYHYKMQELGAASEFLSRYLEIEGPSYSISTACSSSGKVFASAKNLIEADICDLVIVGGVDSLCDLTLGGFRSLDAVSFKPTNPFSVNREGINIGEAAAVFIVSRESKDVWVESHQKIAKKGTEKVDFKATDVFLLGVGESSDAHHMSAPEPSGRGAIAAMQSALIDAAIDKSQVDYINLHGTGTHLNDAMESKAINSLFGSDILCSSTKPLTGHTLGAAGATETALCWLMLKQNENFRIAPHRYDGEYDPKISEIKLAKLDQKIDRLSITMSNSFAFGGNNVSVILTNSLGNGLKA